jgi:hypothetical protein
MPEWDTGQVQDTPSGVNDAEAAAEKRQSPVSNPGGFKNDPDDPSNPNEVIERARRQVRP